jgi:hypothetical protein
MKNIDYINTKKQETSRYQSSLAVPLNDALPETKTLNLLKLQFHNALIAFVRDHHSGYCR